MREGYYFQCTGKRGKEKITYLNKSLDKIRLALNQASCVIIACLTVTAYRISTA